MESIELARAISAFQFALDPCPDFGCRDELAAISLRKTCLHGSVEPGLFREIAIHRLPGKFINGSACQCGDACQLSSLFGGELNVHA